MAAATTLHASCVVVGEAGILIRGPSGSGKSSLAREIVLWVGREAGVANALHRLMLLEEAGYLEGIRFVHPHSDGKGFDPA